MLKGSVRWLAWVLLLALLLQAYFMVRVGLMTVLNPSSTAFERSAMWQLAQDKKYHWAQQWVAYADISTHLKKAVIASEDSGFLEHHGIDWDAIDQARKRNAVAQAQAQKKQAQQQKQQQQKQDTARRRIKKLQQQGKPIPDKLQQIAQGYKTPPVVRAKLVGASTITQQLAKNLFLSGERTLFRKAQEFLLAQYLEWFLSKRRILEIYLNHVEWGAGIYGAEAAAQYYFKRSAAQLTALQAAKLAVMLPRPRYYQHQQQSRYLNQRAHTIAKRMRAVVLPQ